MSLDLYLKSKKTILKKSTGVFIRRNGQTVELETIEEVKQYFPNCDNIKEKEVETDIIWHGNATHNLIEMAENIKARNYNFYQLLWHPEDNGFNELSMDYYTLVLEGFTYMNIHRKELEEYNPDNGWGSYDSLYHFVCSYLEAISKHINEEIIIYTWT